MILNRAGSTGDDTCHAFCVLTVQIIPTVL